MKGSFDSQVLSEQWVTKQIKLYFKQEYPDKTVTSGEIPISNNSDKNIVVDVTVGEDIAVECKGSKDHKRGLGQALYANTTEYEAWLVVSHPSILLSKLCKDLPVKLIEVTEHGIYEKVYSHNSKSELSSTFEPSDATLSWLVDKFDSLGSDEVLARIVKELDIPTTSDVTEKYNELRISNGYKTVEQNTVRKNMKQNDELVSDLENHITSSWTDVLVWRVKEDYKKEVSLD